MKLTSTFFALLICISFGSYGQIIPITTGSNTQNCTTPVNASVFRNKLLAISRTASETEKLVQSKRFVKRNCVSVEQVKELSALFLEDADRLAFTMRAYANTVDKDNFYDVYDTFAYFSNVFRLHDFVSNRRGGSPSVGGGNGSGNGAGGTINFPEYSYPDATNYSGTKFCSNPISEADFLNRYRQIAAKPTDSNKLIASLRMVNNQCLSTEQIMKLSVAFDSENNKLSFLKQAYDAVFDVDNYHQVEQVLSDTYNKQDFQRFLRGKNHGGGTGYPNYGCQVDDREFAIIKQSIERQGFNNAKLNFTRTMFRSKGKCFTVNQLMEILPLFSIESTRLEVAKFAYDYINDTDNYYLTINAFSYNSSKSEMEKFLKTK